MEMAGQLRFKLFKLLKPPPGWKCPKQFKVGLGEPWKSEVSNSEGETLLLKCSLLVRAMQLPPLPP